MASQHEPQQTQDSAGDESVTFNTVHHPTNNKEYNSFLVRLAGHELLQGASQMQGVQLLTSVTVHAGVWQRV